MASGRGHYRFVGIIQQGGSGMTSLKAPAPRITFAEPVAVYEDSHRSFRLSLTLSLLSLTLKSRYKARVFIVISKTAPRYLSAECPVEPSPLTTISAMSAAPSPSPSAAPEHMALDNTLGALVIGKSGFQVQRV